MRRADQITGIVMLVFSLTVAYASWQMPQRVEFGPGMGFFPFWLAVLMAVLSALLLIDASMRKTASSRSPFPARRALLNVVLVLAGLGAYIAFLDEVGFFVSTILFISFLLGVVEKEGWLKTCMVSVLATISLFIVFRILLDVRLPENMFGF
jgi:putative tricarboxylic transport membrane protein